MSRSLLVFRRETWVDKKGSEAEASAGGVNREFRDRDESKK